MSWRILGGGGRKGRWCLNCDLRDEENLGREQASPARALILEPV